MAENPKQGHRGKAQTSGATSIVRISGRDVDGSLNIERALSKVKGVGLNLAHHIALIAESKLSIPKSTAIGTLNESQIEDIEKIIKDPVANNIPWYAINRNKDAETGKDIHVVSNELIFNSRQDVTRDISNKTWRGFRHQYGQKVRGQHTRSTGRTGATIGVTKKSVQPAAAASARGGKPAKPK
jgi:small subunit ribosomal protein S13